MLKVDIMIRSKLWIVHDEHIRKNIRVIIKHVYKSLHLDIIPKPMDISLLLTNDEEMHNLNMIHLQHDYPTNVLSFPSYTLSSDKFIDELKSKDNIFLGDIALGFEKILSESTVQGKHFQDHLSHMLIHSILHLLGFDHESDVDAQKMEDLEILTLNKLNIKNPYEDIKYA